MGNATPIIYDPKKDPRPPFEVIRTVDQYEELLKELFLIRNPKFRFNPDYAEPLKRFVEQHIGGKPPNEAGTWFYFPWDKALIHYLPDAMHQELRTARNKHLIAKEEQDKFYDFKVGIAGLSVGSHAALTIAMMGGGRSMRIADPDEISGSNLNRIRLDYSYVGTNKCDAVARLLYQTNPYADIKAYPQGI